MNISNTVPERMDIINTVTSRSPITRNELIRHLSNNDNTEATSARVDAMIRDGQLCLEGDTVTANLDIQRIGTVVRHPKGFGFLALEGEEADWFITYADMERCFPGERVIAVPRTRDERGVTARIVGRESLLTQVTGQLTLSDNNEGWQLTLNETCTLPVTVQSDDNSFSDGAWVVVDIIKPPSGHRPHEILIRKVLKQPSPVERIRARAVQSQGFPLQHSDIAIREAEQAVSMANGIGGDKSVVDLTHLPFVSIDGESSKDLDDLVYCEPRSDGKYDLWVAIADVSRFVSPDTQMNADAFSRSTSVYTPGMSFPMLPETISHTLCSMLPNKLRYALTVHLTISESGELENYVFMSSKVRSAHRFSYQRVAELMELETLSPPTEKEEPHIKNLIALYSVDLLSRQKGEKDGTMVIEREEPIIHFDAKGDVSGFGATKPLKAHQVIESAMVYANVAAALFLEEHYDAAIYRHHPGLQEKGLDELNGLIEDYGLEPLTTSSSGAECNARRVAIELADGDIKDFDRLLRGAMTFARYSTTATSHFGLSKAQYTHFTSPIRRYGDIVVHRLIKHKLGEHEAVFFSECDAEHVSARSYDANIAERSCSDMLCARWWAQQPPVSKKAIPATVRGNSERMLFLSLGGTPVEGALPLDELFDNTSEPSLLDAGTMLTVDIVDIDEMTGRIRLSLHGISA